VLEAGTGVLSHWREAEDSLTALDAKIPWQGGPITSMAADAAGNLYLPDPRANKVYRVSSAGLVSVFAGTGASSSDGDGGFAVGAGVLTPHGTAVDRDGNVFVAEAFRVRRVTRDGRINRFGLGTSQPGDPKGIALDRRGNLYILQNRLLHVINPAGVQVRIPLDLDPAVNSLVPGNFRGIAALPDGTFYIGDVRNPVLWLLGKNGLLRVGVGRVTRRANCNPESSNCTITAYRGNGSLTGEEYFSSTLTLSVDDAGRLLIADQGNGAIRRLTPGQSLHTVAGTPLCCRDEEGIAAANARFELPLGLASDTAGNIYVADPQAGRLRKIGPDGKVTTILGDGSLQLRKTGSPLATGAQPYSVALDSKGNIYVDEPGLKVIRRITVDGKVERITGPETGEFPILLPKVPSALAVGGKDEVYSLAECNVLRWEGGESKPLFTGKCETSGAGPLETASVRGPTALEVGKDGTLYVIVPGVRLRAVKDGQLTVPPIAGPRGIFVTAWQLHKSADELLYFTANADFGDRLYHTASAATADGSKIFPIANSVFKPGDREWVPETKDPIETRELVGITTDTTGRVIVTQPNPPRLLVFPKVTR